MKCSIKKFSEMYETVYRDLYRTLPDEESAGSRRCGE